MFCSEQQKHVIECDAGTRQQPMTTVSALHSYETKNSSQFCIPDKQQSGTGSRALLHMFYVSKTKSKMSEAKAAAVPKEQEA